MPSTKERLLPPPACPASQQSVIRGGHLLLLTGKGLLHSGSWKRRYCVLDARRLFYYNVKEDQTVGSPQYRDKTSHYVDLDCYDICEEAGASRDVRKWSSTSNVFVVTSADIEKGSHRFFDTGRLYLSAETAQEMNEWISAIRSAMMSLQGGSGAKSRQPAQQSKRNSANATAKAIDNGTRASSPATGVVNRESADGSNDVMASTDHLDCIAVKQRAKGPPGRRPPKQQTLQARLAVQQQQQRSGSLVDIDAIQRRNRITQGHHRQQQQQRLVEPHPQHNRSFDVGRQRKAATIYAYSSSDEDEGLHHLTMVDDDETVETLCEVLPHASSTPSLAVIRQQMSPAADWLSIGASASTPRLKGGSTSKRRVPDGGASSTDDPPILTHLLKQTAALQSCLAGLEADLGASRRDVGWLQENLSTVQGAAGQVSDKVAKMQVQVATMERQITGAVKEAQQMQQRANDALESAADAERDFRRLEGDCQVLLSQLRRSSGESLSISPMTPVQRVVPSELPVPPSFDFASMLSGAGSSAKSPIIKSSLRSESKSVPVIKSITFGPTTTFATSPTTEVMDDDVLSDIPVATSTLKKSPSRSLQADFNQNSSHTTKNL